MPGVARVALWGVQDRRIYLDASLSQLTQLGISEASLERAVAQQNAVAAAGSVTLARQRVPVTPSGQFPAPESVADLLVQASPVESYQRPAARSGRATSSGSATSPTCESRLSRSAAHPDAL